MDNITIKEAIQAISKDKGAQMYSALATVTAVDKQARTIDAAPVDGDAEILGAYLQAIESGESGFCPIPVVGSSVIITFITKNVGFVSLCTEVEEIKIDTPLITINEGENGPLINFAPFITELEKVQRNVEKLKAAIDGAVVVPNDGGAALKAAVLAVALAKPNFSEENIADKKILH